MPNYQQSRVYKLINSIDDQMYVGCTTRPLSQRKSKHRYEARRNPNRKVYAHFNTVGWENVRIILVELCPVNTKEQLLAREQHYIDLLQPTLNSNSSIDNCPHGRAQNRCADCGGSNMCEHGHQKNNCKICNAGKYVCFECDTSYTSKFNLSAHCRRQTHRDTCIRQYLEVFDYVLPESEIPMY